VPISPAQLPDDTQALKRIIAAMAQDAVAAQAEIAKLRFQLARYRLWRCQYVRAIRRAFRQFSQPAWAGRGNRAVGYRDI